MHTMIGDGLMADQVQAVLSRRGASGWTVRTDTFWCHVQPPGYLPQEQGWKLHVSATPLSAALVTTRAADVLVQAGCAFKVAAGLSQLGRLVSANADRRSSGKVITAYPRDDEAFAALAELLHRATEHLPGPGILSDRAYRPGSLVHYRYGVFTGRTVLGNDGSFESRLVSPAGTLVRDERAVGCYAPGWASRPLEPGDVSPDAGDEPGPVLLAGRFAIRQAIRHGNKGGVFVGTDLTTGEEVVVKQARPHVGAMLDGRDARDWLRNEATMLERLAPFGLTARPVALFEHQDHLFLAQERIEGEPLADRAGGTGTPVEQIVGTARSIVALLATLHGEGLVIRDLSPANLLVTPGGAVKLVDLEFMAVPGAPVPIVGTPGYAAPEQFDDPSGTGIAPAPGQAADRYSLGVLLLVLSTGTDPSLVADEPSQRSVPHRSVAQRLARLVRMTASSSPVTRLLAPAVLGLIADDPDRRWSLARVDEFLAHTRSRPGRSEAPTEPDRLSPAAQDALLAEGFAWLLDTLDPQRLWPLGRNQADSDPRAVQHGAGGVVAVLARAARVLDDPRLAEAARAASHVLLGRYGADEGDRLLPGLYFGASGSVWALHDAALLLGDDALAARAEELARTIPVVWPNPDVCHGTAGAGLTQLHFWRATGKAAFAARARESAEHLLATVARRDGGVRWRIPEDFDSALAGLEHYGFAHGVAGIGAFLLAAGQAAGEDRYLRLAQEAGQTLADAATVDGGCAWWPVGEEPDPTVPWRMPHWCSGSSGVGTFLIRLWRATGHRHYLELSEGAARAVREHRWGSSTAHCHGLAGDGQFLLDLPGPRHRAWAEELAACLQARAVYRDGRLVVPDDAGEVTAGYGTGLAGVLSFLLRLRHGGARPWMP